MNTKHLILVNHNTLTKQHISLCIRSISKLVQNEEVHWDFIHIYNDHDDIDNNFIMDELERYSISYSNCEVLIPRPQKTLNAILKTISEHKFSSNDIVVLLKADYSINGNLSKVIDELEYKKEFLYSLPVINCKSWVRDTDIMELSSRGGFLVSDYETYYRGSDCHPPLQEISVSGRTDVDPNIKYVSWGGSLDLNVHILNGELVNNFNTLDPDVGWSRCPVFEIMKRNGVEVVNDKRLFCIHKYHTATRNDPRKNIPGQEY